MQMTRREQFTEMVTADHDSNSPKRLLAWVTINRERHCVSQGRSSELMMAQWSIKRGPHHLSQLAIRTQRPDSESR